MNRHIVDSDRAPRLRRFCLRTAAGVPCLPALRLLGLLLTLRLPALPA